MVLREATVTGRRRLEKKERVRRAKKEDRRRIHPKLIFKNGIYSEISHEEL